MAHDPKFDAAEHPCTCFVTPEHMWLSAASCGYGSGYEPGSQMEWNPDCLAHPDTSAAHCHGCGRVLAVGESVWASDWTVIAAEGTRTEIRYTCDDCEAKQ